MLIAFVGTPCSGKTTTAARVFADLKDAGYAAEFLPEAARTYIARRRFNGNEKGPLTDWDQFSIMNEQRAAEVLMHLSSPDSIAIADSAALNALLYMTEDFSKSPDIVEYAKEAVARYTLVFRCHPVRAGEQYDPNRVHSFEDSLRLDKKVEPLLESLQVPFVALTGSQRVRSQRAYGAVLETIVKGGVC